jgi:hypothetical protein
MPYSVPSNLTSTEYETLRNKAILKFSSVGYKTVVESIYRFKPTVAQERLDLIWACMYVINLYDPTQAENYITETQLLNIADQLQRA